MNNETLANELKKTMKHIETANFEMGNIESRIGKLEGRIDEGFINIKTDVSQIVNKIEKLPCSEHIMKITTLETNQRDIIKLKYIAITAIISLIIWIISSLT